MLPVSKKNHVGIEIEFYSLARAEEIVLELNKYLRSTVAFELSNDGSIDPPSRICLACTVWNVEKMHTCYKTHELKILMEEDRIAEVMLELKQAFKVIQPKVNDSCGFHVHLDCRNRKKETLFKNLVNCQELFLAMQPKTRRDSRYCKKNDTKTYKQSIENEGRYHIVNAHAFEKYQTIEVRIHQGCVNTDTMQYWIKLLLKLANRKRSFSLEVKKFNHLKDVIKIDKEEEEYVKKTISKYA